MNNNVNNNENDKPPALETTEASVKSKINDIWKAIIEIKSIVKYHIHNKENDSTKKNPTKGGKQDNQNQETVTSDTKLSSSQEKQPPVLVESSINANKASSMVDVTDYKQQTVINYFKPVDKKS